MQGAVYAGLVALAGISGAGLGGAALLGGIKVFDRLLQGDKASSALWSGFKTGAVAAAAGQIGQQLAGQAQAGEITTTGSAESYTTIANTPVIPGQPLTPDQMTAIKMSLESGNTYPPEIMAQYNAQLGGGTAQVTLPAADAAIDNQANIQAAQEWATASPAEKLEIQNVTGLTPEQLQQLANSETVTQVVKQGDTLSQIAQNNGTSVEALMRANPDITNPDSLKVGQQLNIPSEQASTYAGGVGTASDTAAKVASGEYSQSAISQGIQAKAQAAQAATGAGEVVPPPAVEPNFGPGGEFEAVWNGETKSYDIYDMSKPDTPVATDLSQSEAMKKAQDLSTGSGPNAVPPAPQPQKAFSAPTMTAESRALWFDKDMTVRAWALNESLGDPRGGVYLTPLGVAEVLRRVDEGILDKIKGVGKGIAQSAKKGWNSATNKVTFDKLKLNWEKSGAYIGRENPDGTVTGAGADHEVIAEFLRDQGIQIPLINSVFKSMGIPEVNTGSVGGDQTQAATATQGQQAQAGSAQTTAAQQATDTSQTTASPAQTAQPADGATTAGTTAQAAGGRVGAKQAKQAIDQAVTQVKKVRSRDRTNVVNYGKTQLDAVPVKAATPADTTAATTPASTTSPRPKLGPTKVVGGTKPGAPTDAERAKLDQRIQQAMASQPQQKVAESRVYGGRYIKESVNRRLLAEFEHFINKLD
jgi:LysM repeat protein